MLQVLYGSKNARKKIVELNINDDDIINEFSKNRNMCVNVINSINLWIENSLLLQNSIDDPLCNCESKVDAVLFVRVYLYGLASKALSLLALSKKYGETELFYGIRISPNEDEPIEVIRYHPVIYFNPSLIGNQDSFQLDITDYQNIDSSTFGMGFQSLHNSSLLMSLRAMSTFQAELLKDGKYSHVVISKARFIALVNKYTSGQVDGECFFNAFVLTKDKVTSQLKGEETIIWMMGVNKYRHELRPFICLDNNTIAISYMALEQAKHIWLSYPRIFCQCATRRSGVLHRHLRYPGCQSCWHLCGKWNDDPLRRPDFLCKPKFKLLAVPFLLLWALAVKESEI